MKEDSEGSETFLNVLKSQVCSENIKPGRGNRL